MKRILYISFLCLLSLSYYSCSEDDDSTPNEPTKFGWIEGQIIDSNTGLGIPRVELVLTNNTEHTPEKRDRTSDDGSYRFEKLDRGIYRLEINKEGYQAESIYPIQVVSNQASKGDKKLKVKVVSIEGIIKTENTPLANAYAYLIPVGNKGTKVEVNSGTNPDGKFSFANLPIGEKYKLLVFKDGYQSMADREVIVPDENANVIMKTKTAENISFDKTFIDMGESGTIAVFAINTGADQNTLWSLTTEASWISLDTTEGKGNASITINNIDRNYLSGKNNERSAKIVAKTSDGKYDELWVIVSEAGKGINIGDILVLPAKEVTSNSATISSIFLDNDLKMNAKQIGVCYSSTNKEPVFDSDDSESAELNSIDAEGIYTVSLKNLAAGKTYYVRAYVIDKTTNKFHYSPNIRSFITSSSAPSVKVESISDVTETSAKLRAEILFAGEPSYTECGFVYSTTEDPVIKSTAKKIPVSEIVKEKYEYVIGGLAANQQYHVRAYAVNTHDTVYSNDISFITEKKRPQLLTLGVTGVSSSSALLNADITEEGLPAYNERGFCYSKNSAPTVANNKIVVTDSGNGQYSKNISGLEHETTYYVRAYVRQGTDIIYGNEVTFRTIWIKTGLTTSGVTKIKTNTATFNGTINTIGTPPYTQRGFCYNTYGTPTVSDTRIIVNGAGTADNFFKDITGLQEGTTYHVCAYVIQDGKAIYGETVSFETDRLPVITTEEVTNIISGSLWDGTAQFNGSIQSIGHPAYVERGFVYATISNPTINNQVAIASGRGVAGRFSAKITELIKYQTYYVRTYVKTSSGSVVYGNMVSFKTN